MDDRELQHLASLMTEDGRIYPNVMSRVYETMLCRSAEAVMPTVGRIIAAAQQAGETSRQTARKFGDGESLSAFSLPSGSPQHGALVLQTPTASFLVVAEYDRDSASGGAKDIKQMSVRPATRGLVKTLNAVVTGQYVTDTMFSIHPSHQWPNGEHGGRWSSFGESRDLDQWTKFFPALRETMAAYGQTTLFHEDASAMAARSYVMAGVSQELDAADLLGGAIAAADSYLPDQAARDGLQALEAINAEQGIQRHLGQLLQVHAMCQDHGYTTVEGGFDHNDIRNMVAAPDSGTPYVDQVVFQDPNSAFAVNLYRGQAGSLNGLVVRSGPPRALDKGTPLAPLACFSVDAAGVVSVEIGPKLERSSIMAWNSFIADISTAKCCLEMEHPKSAAPEAELEGAVLRR